MKKIIKKINQYYSNLRLQSKLMFTYLIIISIPMLLLGLFFYSRVYDMIVADTIRNEQQESTKTAPAIEAALDEILSDFSSLQEESLYQQMFSPVNTKSITEIASLADVSDFNQKVDATLDHQVINSFKIYVDADNSTISDLSKATNGVVSSLKSIGNTYWQGIFSGSGISSLYCPSFYLSKQEQNKYGDLAYISKRSLYVKGESFTTFTVAYFSSEKLKDILYTNLSSEGSVAYIINERDSIVTSTSPALSSTYYLNYNTIRDSFMSSNNFLQRRVLDEDIYACMYNISQPEWYMVVVIPSQPLIEKSNILAFQYFSLYFFCIIFALIISYFLSRSITNRIAIINNQMSKVRTGPPSPLRTPEVHDEIGDLIDTYNYMSEEMNQLLKERSRAAEELRIAEFNSLQAQINPHFLYNTMDMINWMAAQGRTDEITAAVQSLSKFYKLTLSKKESISTIEQEIQHVSIYIKLQNMRYHDSIDFVVDIPGDMMDFQIPKLTLQPVVENAILHGIMEKESKSGTIVLTGWLENNNAILLISDDGAGMNTDQLSNILKGEGVSKTGSNIAIYNTHHRIQVLYGKEYGLSYESTLNKGTDVYIRIPIKMINEISNEKSIVQVSTKESTNQDAFYVDQTTLLNLNQKSDNDIYVLSNFHQLSEKFPYNTPFYILSHSVDTDFPAHEHTYYEMSYLYKGQIINSINGHDIIQTAGDFIILNRKSIQSIKPLNKDSLLINLCVMPRLFETDLKGFYTSSNKISTFLREEDNQEKYYLCYSLKNYNELQIMLMEIIQSYTMAEYQSSTHTIILFEEFLNSLSELNPVL